MIAAEAALASPATWQWAATVAANLALATAAGALGWRWMAAGAGPSSAWTSRARVVAVRALRAGAVVAALAHLAGLWIEAATMGDVPLSQAGPMIGPVLSGTAWGTAWGVGAAGIGVLLAGAFAAGDRSRAPRRLAASVVAGVGVASLAASRGLSGHAADAAGWAVPLADATHALAAASWAGAVIVGATGLLGAGAAGLAATEEVALDAAIERLSTWATVALALVLASGAVLAWPVLSRVSWSTLAGSDWGRLLGAKLVLVAAAVGLGGWNRVVVMPAIASAATPLAGRDALAAFRRVLAVEAVVLALALAGAGALAASAQPG